MEHKTETGIYISVITRDKMIDRAENLSGEDLKTFVEKCNPASQVRPNSFLAQNILGMSGNELLAVCKELEPNFNPKTDYYVLRPDQSRTVHSTP
jgi:hypothetical protein